MRREWSALLVLGLAGVNIILSMYYKYMYYTKHAAVAKYTNAMSLLKHGSIVKHRTEISVIKLHAIIISGHRW